MRLLNWNAYLRIVPNDAECDIKLRYYFFKACKWQRVLQGKRKSRSYSLLLPDHHIQRRCQTTFWATRFPMPRSKIPPSILGFYLIHLRLMSGCTYARCTCARLILCTSHTAQKIVTSDCKATISFFPHTPQTADQNFCGNTCGQFSPKIAFRIQWHHLLLNCETGV